MFKGKGLGKEFQIMWDMQVNLIGAMDTRWQWSKACDVGVTLSRTMDAHW
jgi:hypothetical protein